MGGGGDEDIGDFMAAKDNVSILVDFLAIKIHRRIDFFVSRVKEAEDLFLRRSTTLITL